MAKREKGTKKLKDLDPKAQGKNVKGGRNYLGRDVNRILNRDVPRATDDIVDSVTDAIHDTVNPR